MSSSPSCKRSKLSPTLPFTPKLLSPSSIASLRSQVEASQPYKHAVIPQLFEHDFLEKARKELCESVSFTEKETDIYRISQTGDLTNLSGLPAAEQAQLGTLTQLRDALYSSEFRSFLQKVTGCGPLSGIKTDMSCAEYGEGSYLLNHDDVIGTRRISFILYLVKREPEWRAEWGGALELYPVVPSEGDRPNIPEPKPSVSIPPAFNQFTFFKVQPGHSFHSVEEVVIEGQHGPSSRGGIGSRLSLSGWFHKPIEGEEGYEQELKEEQVEGAKGKSSLQQLYKTTLKEATAYEGHVEGGLLEGEGKVFPSDEDRKVLGEVLNPSYLVPKTIAFLQSSFAEQGHLALSSFLSKELSAQIETLLRQLDAGMNKGRKGAIVGGQVVNLTPRHEEGVGKGWALVGPPHLQRFLAWGAELDDDDEDELAVLLKKVKSTFESTSFARLLATLTGVTLKAYTLDLRRFRPGLDYTLARGVEEGHILDVGLGLTPEPEVGRERELWEEGDVGGWEVWLDGGEGEEGDEATYGGGRKKKSTEKQGETGADSEEEEDEEEDGPLLSLEPSWNRLSIVLRDPGVLKFVKYVSAKAPGSRFDLSGEWDVEVAQDKDDE
ncbi:BQ5605_C001g00006 [Microbotryum silenes-dioicae]|uniref:BQ5605_C001g00006 protein n=1 Tax=Microbotryum silenes-dioicae TaxID=796604 RepID=A0A2X0P518_9BASI|nr:BQ5605_C001g00006 [Microbotryum silenes-dioicae]